VHPPGPVLRAVHGDHHQGHGPRLLYEPTGGHRGESLCVLGWGVLVWVRVCTGCCVCKRESVCVCVVCVCVCVCLHACMLPIRGRTPRLSGWSNAPLCHHRLGCRGSSEPDLLRADLGAASAHSYLARQGTPSIPHFLVESRRSPLACTPLPSSSPPPVRPDRRDHRQAAAVRVAPCGGRRLTRRRNPAAAPPPYAPRCARAARSVSFTRLRLEGSSMFACLG
jgi:hypothetical protein